MKYKRNNIRCIGDIQKLRKTEVVHDKVSGSNPDFPFQAQNFNISGQVEHYMESSELEKEKQLLQDRMVKARYKKIKVEKWMANAPARIQRLVRLKYFERLSCRLSQIPIILYHFNREP